MLAFNILKKLNKKYQVYVIAIGTNYCTKRELSLIHKDLKKNKIKFFEIKGNISYLKKPLRIYNFFNKNYINENNIEKAKKFLSQINFKNQDIIFSYGAASIIASSNIDCIKIALFEDIQNEVEFYRTFNSINKYNFLKKTIRLILLKIHFRHYYKWLKSISNNHQIKYTFSPYDYTKLKDNLKLSVLPLPMAGKLLGLKNKIKKQNEKFNISMLSTYISQDYVGVNILFKKLIPILIKKKIFNKVRINLIMRIPKSIPDSINKILNSKFINLRKYNKKILRETDLLFYPSKYPVGVRSKILFAFSNSWIVATSNTIKKCIPELIDGKNCLMSDNINSLANKIVNTIEKPNKNKFLIKEGYKILKKYSVINCYKKIDRDITEFSIKK